MKTLTGMQEAYNHYLQAEKQSATACANQKEAEHRQDEANLDKVRANIYGVFEALANADATRAKNAGDEEAAFKAFIAYHTERFSVIPQPWRNRRSEAEAHDDIATCAIEDTKLETVEKIKAEFERLKGCEQ